MTEQRFIVTVRHCSGDEIPSEAVFLAVQDAVSPGGRLNENGRREIDYVDATDAR